MIEVHRQAAQGDVLFRRVDRIPHDACEQARDGAIIVAHSESGHHHVIATPDTWLFHTLDPRVSYLRLDGPFADVVHQRPVHTHETLRLRGSSHGPTYFEVRRQREEFEQTLDSATD